MKSSKNDDSALASETRAQAGTLRDRLRDGGDADAVSTAAIERVLPASVPAEVVLKPVVSIKFEADDRREYLGVPARGASFLVGFLAAALIGLATYFWRI